MEKITTKEYDNQNQYIDSADKHVCIGLDSTIFLAYRDLAFIINEHLISKIPKNCYNILDYGCGAGTSTKAVIKCFDALGKNNKIYGIDQSPYNIDIAKKQNIPAEFICINQPNWLEDLPKFDLILCNFVLLENTLLGITAILDNIYQLLGVNAIAIITNCNAVVYEPGKKWYSFHANHPENSQHTNCSTPNNYEPSDGQRVKSTVFDKKTNISFTFYDYYYTGLTYQKAYKNSDLTLIATRLPIGSTLDGKAWLSEKKHAPYRIDVLCKCEKT